jgi:hypothetical protein
MSTTATTQVNSHIGDVIPHLAGRHTRRLPTKQMTATHSDNIELVEKPFFVMSPTDETLVYEVGPGYMLSSALSSLFGLRKFRLPTNFVLGVCSSHRSRLRRFERSKFTATFERL